MITLIILQDPRMYVFHSPLAILAWFDTPWGTVVPNNHNLTRACIHTQSSRSTGENWGWLFCAQSLLQGSPTPPRGPNHAVHKALSAVGVHFPSALIQLGRKPATIFNEIHHIPSYFSKALLLPQTDFAMHQVEHYKGHHRCWSTYRSIQPHNNAETRCNRK